MKILLIEDDQKIGELVAPLLESSFQVNVDIIHSIQNAVELMEGPWEEANIIVCDYHGPSRSLMRCVAELAKKIPIIFVIDENQKLSELLLGFSEPHVHSIDRQFLSKELLAKIAELGTKGAALTATPADKEKIAAQKEKLDQFLLNADINPEEARATAETSLEVIQDLTEKLGFTPEVRALAAKSVELTLKLLGSKPKLSAITESLKRNEGKYLASHSIMLAEICCAIACRVGWNSAPTFFKLTLAAYLHDMAIKDNELARCRTLDDAKKLNPAPAEGLLSFKLHPARAAEFARKFNEIPPDVDTIIAQHHERPDGTGFPRGLFQTQLAPLSCLFIIAEDMLHFFLENEADGDVARFVLARSDMYQLGVFKKIMKALT